MYAEERDVRVMCPWWRSTAWSAKPQTKVAQGKGGVSIIERRPNVHFDRVLTLPSPEWRRAGRKQLRVNEASNQWLITSTDLNKWMRWCFAAFTNLVCPFACVPEEADRKPQVLTGLGPWEIEFLAYLRVSEHNLGTRVLLLWREGVVPKMFNRV